ncbi:Cysteine desulfurase [Labrenzia sp. THAF82]|uniref:aminotransferase class V-fold PLP-dependent enzyme n=1 Tax=Labrenzia sp. THAF82 TaxID=2587861 RepID=UPI0012686102|nr:aminotransferase class V-fold PLP-dependent enzyme [Labrenzia sp. THAF82]QFT32222.1 Cysteine desulfurase [Labrenzia sp. THAF82]
MSENSLAVPLEPVFDLAAIRTDFPALSEGVYANFGARGVMSNAAIDAVSSFLTSLQDVGPASRIASALIAREQAALSRTLARLTGAEPEDIVYLGSISQAMALAFAGIVWRAGDVLVIGEAEPPGSWLWAREIERRYDVKVRTVPRPYGGPTFAQHLADRLCERTRLVVLSHVDWVTGDVVCLRQSVEAVHSGPAARAILAVDGAQAAGISHVDLKDLDIDLYALTAQKWLGGPDGLAAAVVRSARLLPSQIGWRGCDLTSEDQLVLTQTAQRFGSGSLPVALLPAWTQALEVADRHMPLPQRCERATQMAKTLHGNLKTLASRYGGMVVPDTIPSNGITACRFERITPGAVVNALAARGIQVRSHHWPECVRFCLHYMSSPQDIAEISNAVETVLAS